MMGKPEQTECIADLLGPKAEAKGGGCMCSKCRAEREEKAEASSQKSEEQPQPIDGKTAATGEKEDAGK